MSELSAKDEKIWIQQIIDLAESADKSGNSAFKAFTLRFAARYYSLKGNETIANNLKKEAEGFFNVPAAKSYIKSEIHQFNQ